MIAILSFFLSGLMRENRPGIFFLSILVNFLFPKPLSVSSLELEKNSAGGLIMDEDRQDIIIYNTADAKATVSLYAKDGNG
jgi:hypothetical protein